MALLYLALALAPASVCVSAPSAVYEDQMEQRLSALEQLADSVTNIPTIAKANLLRRKYQSLFPVTSPSSEISESELISRFIAADLVSFYSGDIGDTSALLLLGEELESRQYPRLSSARKYLGLL